MTTREQAIAFRERGRLLCESKDLGYKVFAGDIYQAQTVRGNKNLIVAFRIVDDFMLYGHGDKVKKCPLHEFLRGIESGDLELKYIDEIDVERISMCQIMLDAIANRCSFEEAVDMQLDQAEEIARGMNGIPN